MKVGYGLLGIAIGVAGLIVLAFHSPWIAAGVFLAIWGNNVERSARGK